ncbi:RusA family crossover junction endodeoxyribonuclease [Salmonella enterica]|nr:RusA family crossover junction endodeoxyribonuclease [Salmonella enterica]EJQ1601331.1 RusA family crossover junction endodeoxyribonuclease [Salmonella enterica]
MAKLVEFVMSRMPVSHQCKNKANKKEWMEYVSSEGVTAWNGQEIITDKKLKFLMIYLADFSMPGDINNFVKPVQDALNEKIYSDDVLIKDVSAHMRFLDEPNDPAGLPDILGKAIIDGNPCVYVAIYDSIELSEVV